MDKYCCRPSQPRAEIGTLSCAQMHENRPTEGRISVIRVVVSVREKHRTDKNRCRIYYSDGQKWPIHKHKMNDNKH